MKPKLCHNLWAIVYTFRYPYGAYTRQWFGWQSPLLETPMSSVAVFTTRAKARKFLSLQGESELFKTKIVKL